MMYAISYTDADAGGAGGASFFADIRHFLHAQVFFIYTIHIVRRTHCVSSNTNKQVLLLSRRYAFGFRIRIPFSMELAIVFHCAVYVWCFSLAHEQRKKLHKFLSTQCYRKILHIKHSIDVLFKQMFHPNAHIYSN